MKETFVVVKEKHNDVEIETYPSVYKAAYFMLQFASSLGVDVKAVTEKVNNEKKRLITFTEDKSKDFTIMSLLPPIYDGEGHLTFSDENWEYWMTFLTEEEVKTTRTLSDVSNIVYVHPYLGKIPILTSIFQMGWVETTN